MRCPNCGRQNPPPANYCESCGTPLTGGAPPQTDTLEYAGFWRRVGAYLIDGVILGIAIMIIAFICVELEKKGWSDDNAASFFCLSLFMISWLYYAAFEASSFMATPGKIAINIVVTDLTGKRISFGKATGRFFGKFLSIILLLIGYLMAGFTPKKQTLHDMMAGCLVITLKSLPPQPIAFKDIANDRPESKKRVIKDITPLFLEADFSAMVIKGLTTGEVVELMGVKEANGSKWLEVKCSDGQTGFIAGDTQFLSSNTQ